jgi:tetratricopeptide (TPR) repeat protein
LEQAPVQRAETMNLYANALAHPHELWQDADDLYGRALEQLDQRNDDRVRAAIHHDRALSLMSRRRYADALLDSEMAESLAGRGSYVFPAIRNARVGVLNHLGLHAEALKLVDEALPTITSTYGEISWPSATALRERGRALEAIASETGRESDKARAKAALRKYRVVLDELESKLDGAPGHSVTI